MIDLLTFRFARSSTARSETNRVRQATDRLAPVQEQKVISWSASVILMLKRPPENAPQNSPG
jgi:hypothetical protein